ncbi:putative phenylalanine aminotransferase [Nocardioides szechwanensis]|uniref:Aromatic amino acid aminotransferase n=1 Tax=Nocardioides szechwanensis TaxID=1005944 RepID=A0A1H0EA41_9ACTN|nr:histidinol-phosphate transaminase [Nocardioides szechwanensis]GEP34732.1 putative phenylalanine aminotransferase [Nocardioides szechwanensis]SDN79262.1 histidinol-phosphate aminotransferase [Nocardioides szechwanensis]
MAHPQPRSHIDRIPTYVPGKPPTPRAGLTTYKLSSNENPYPPLPGVVEAAEAAVAVMNRYPDMGSTALYDALAARLQVPVSDLVAATGSVALVYQLLAAFCDPGDEVVYAWRSFEAYPIAVTAAAATSVQVPVTADGRHDLAAMAAAVTERTKVVIVCTPNNPTGPSVTQSDLDAFLAAVPSHVVVVVDEAYLEFVRMDDAVDGLATYRAHPNVVLFRTFSKAYGLAGLRVGYAVAATPIAGALRAVSLPFGVSHIAQAAAIASLAAEDALLERVEALTVERARVAADLAAAGWDVPEPQGNFVWFALGERTAEFATACDAAGIVVRPFAGEGARISIGEPEANDRLLEVARAWHL